MFSVFFLSIFSIFLAKFCPYLCSQYHPYFADQLAKPVADVINSSIRQGLWPDVLKLEFVVPVPKVFPLKSFEELRKY